jgi:uncharacterized membrane protein YdbT with pleckstrin-like domain
MGALAPPSLFPVSVGNSAAGEDDTGEDPHCVFYRHSLYFLSMSYLDDHLLDDEEIVYRARLHWTIFILPIIVVLLGIALAIVLRMYEPAYWYFGALLAGIGLLLAIGPAINYTSTEFAVTNKRVLSKTGFIQRESDETLLSKVEAVSIDQGVLGRLLGFGTLTLTGSGGTEDSFPRIAQPLELRRQIQNQVVALEERRGASSAAVPLDTEGNRVERECPYCAERILARARVCKHCGRDVVPATG